ncbi:MAG TPA: hypothetical protein PKD74_04890 [Candidatus Dependentiae bacterium]|nr:hypothetical protein [Candidatus Dependentiae bacterium]
MLNDMQHIIVSGLRYYNMIRADEHGRYRSWEHCYGVFSKYRAKELTSAELDYLSLHLSFYLASWGMYRGSSFLLQRDYTVHIPAIQELMKPQYLALWDVKCNVLIRQENLDSLFVLSEKLKMIYSSMRVTANLSIDKPAPCVGISDVLITKILMGTMGCVPAYDRFFCSAVKRCKVSSALYNIHSIQKLCAFYAMNEETFEKCRTVMSQGRIDYPQMKVIDMCFWQIGYEDEFAIEKNAVEESL